MIRRLRSRHRWWIVAAALACGIGLPAALLVRPDVPRTDDLADLLASASTSSAGRPSPGGELLEIGRWADLWRGEARLTTRLLRDGAGRGILELRGESPPAAPDLLVYWDPSASTPGDPEAATLPGEARLLGRLVGRVTAPDSATRDSPPAARFSLRMPAPRGVLYLYSLGHGRVVAWARLPEPGATGGPEES